MGQPQPVDASGSSEVDVRPSTSRARLVLGAALSFLASVGLAACGSTASARPLKAGQILRVDALTSTVGLRLDAGWTDADGGFNFDGFGLGAMTVSVPLGWTVEVTCRNNSTQFTHSCAVVRNVALSPAGGPVVFGAASHDPTTGLSYGSSATFSFRASKVGRYRIACLVTGHEADGMWDWFVVSSGGVPAVHT